MAKGHELAVVATFQIKLLCVVEHPVVPIGRAISDADDRASVDVNTLQREVNSRSSEQRLHRTLEPQHLLDQNREVLLWFRLQQVPLLGVLYEQANTTRLLIRSGLGSANECIGHHLGM